MKKNRSVRAVIFTSIVFMFSAVAFAAVSQVTGGFEDIGGIVNSFTKNIVSTLGTLFATAAMVAFFYGIVQYIWGVRDGKPDKVTAGNKFMISGLVALFVMFSVWGIITYTQTIFGIQGRNTIVIPHFDIQAGTANPGTNPATPPPNNGLPVAPPATTQPNRCDGLSEIQRAACLSAQSSPTCGANETLSSDGKTCVVVNGLN